MERIATAILIAGLSWGAGLEGQSAATDGVEAEQPSVRTEWPSYRWTAVSDSVFAYLNAREPDRWSRGRPPNTANLKATPLMVDGVIYLNTPLSIGVALDARSGRTLWTYNPGSYDVGTPSMTLTWNQRGVGYWSDGEDARVYWGTGDAYLICVQATTGRPCEDFGHGGRVDLVADVPNVDRGQRDWNNQMLYSVQAPPFVVGNTVIRPQSISSLSITREMPPGWMRGFDARTGETLWTFHTIPQPGEFGHDTWENDAWSYTGKSADEELGLVYLPLNTAAPDFYGGERPGDNLFAESLVALDVETGERAWHYQTVHHGLWDYDLPAAPNLIDVEIDGDSVAAVAQITKQGFVFVFDRATGEPIWPIEERPVPTDTDLSGETPSPTQPFPIRTMAEDAVAGYRLGPLDTLTRTLLIHPLTAGGTNDGPRLVAYAKDTGVELGSVDLPGPALGTPMTYALDGRQYIALTVGGQPVPELVSFALPG